MNDKPIPSEKDEKAEIRNSIWSQCQLVTQKGRQYWVIPPLSDDPFSESPAGTAAWEQAFRFDREENANSGDRLYRFLCEGSSGFEPRTNHPFPAKQAALRGLHYYQKLQADDGHWPGDYGGPLFLLPGLIFASAITESPFSFSQQLLMKQYMLNHQRKDGGWGLHIEGESTMFGTVLQYAALRLLGMQAQTPELQKARTWILERGGAVNIPSWGKFYLAVLGVYEWRGCQSLFPEMWMLPRGLPLHPGRYWCHARMVYLPMAYCYGHRVKGPRTALTESLKQELYPTEYDRIDWAKARSAVAREDQYTHPSGLLKILQRLLNLYERVPLRPLRKKALDFILEYVEAEDEQTQCVDIGPVNQIINSLCVWHAYGRESEAFQKHVDRWKDYLWLAEDGMKMNGYNGSQLWDTAFAVQAITEGRLEREFPAPLEKAYRYLEMTQVREDVPRRKRFFRHASAGGWPFSTLDHGWPITDCTAEGVSATLKIHEADLQLAASTPRISKERLRQAIDLILSFQNKDGGWATYELQRGPSWLELLNPSEVFGGIMVDYPYTECSSACIRALADFQRHDPQYRTGEIAAAIDSGLNFIRRKQRADGSWFGSWAVCFTYGTWFGVEALAETGAPLHGDPARPVDPALERACHFLLEKQRSDGGWGESYASCLQGEYIQHEESQIINTSWALLALMAARSPEKVSIEKGFQFLVDRQEENGDWPQQGISGVFNRSCMITYTAYRNVFPIWALGRYARIYGADAG